MGYGAEDPRVFAVWHGLASLRLTLYYRYIIGQSPWSFPDANRLIVIVEDDFVHFALAAPRDFVDTGGLGS